MKNIDLAPDQAGFKGDLNVPKYCFVLEIALLTGRNKNRLNLPHCIRYKGELSSGFKPSFLLLWLLICQLTNKCRSQSFV